MMKTLRISLREMTSFPVSSTISLAPHPLPHGRTAHAGALLAAVAPALFDDDLISLFQGPFDNLDGIVVGQTGFDLDRGRLVILQNVYLLPSLASLASPRSLW